MCDHLNDFNVRLLLFQARADELGHLAGARQATAHAHCPSGELPRYYCRFQLPGDALATETPAGRTPAQALDALRQALLERVASESEGRIFRADFP